jgi:hypothetical protein
MDSRKRSQIVALTLIGLPFGALTIAEMLPPGREMRRNIYSSREECEQDYRRDQCQQGSGTSSTSYYGGRAWYGPDYYADRSTAEARTDPGTGRTGRVTRTETSTRGGFGGFGRSAHASTGS